MRLGPLALLLPQASQAHGGAQFQCLRLLAAGDVQSALQPGFRLRHLLPCAGLRQQELTLKPMQFYCPPVFSRAVHGCQHLGQQDKASVSAHVQVVPGMGTGGLETLRGEADLTIAGHHDEGYELTLTYSLD